jgi:glycosyltransferase involved in cell wall biosynthesis
LVESGWARKLTVRLQPDLLVTNGALGAAFGSRFPRIHVYHGVTLARWRILPPTDRLRYRLRYTAQLASAELFSGIGAYRVTVSERTAGEVERLLRLRVHRVIENGVDTEVFTPLSRRTARRLLRLPEGGRIALTVGGDEYRKGADIFVAACRAAGWLPVCAGNHLAGALNLGRLDPRSLALAYNASDAVIFASRYEAASLALLEALSCRAVPLVSNVGSVPSLLKRSPSLSECLIDVETRSVADKLNQIAASPQRFQAAAADVSEVVRSDLSLKVVEDEWTSLLASAASNRWP